jgi:hypothetical protein
VDGRPVLCRHVETRQRRPGRTHRGPSTGRLASRGRGLVHQRFVDSFDALADRLARGQIAEDEVTTCTGEEMALHLVIDFAEGEFDSGFDSDAEALDRLPDCGDADHDFERARDVLLRDEDVLMFYDASLDEIDDPDNDLAAAYRTVNLHPSRWFLPFLDTSAS